MASRGMLWYRIWPTITLVQFVALSGMLATMETVVTRSMSYAIDVRSPAPPVHLSTQHPLRITKHLSIMIVVGLTVLVLCQTAMCQFN